MAAVNKLTSSKLFSIHKKIEIYKTTIRTIISYGAEMWTLDKNTKKKLIKFKNKVFTKVFRPTKENGTLMIKHNKKIFFRAYKR